MSLRCDVLDSHDERFAGMVSDTWLVTTYRQCRRCQRVRAVNVVTVKGFDRALRGSGMTETIRRDLYQRNPLLARIERNR